LFLGRAALSTLNPLHDGIGNKASLTLAWPQNGFEAL